jgi:MFS family permease
MSASSLTTATVAWLYGRIAARVPARILVPLAFVLYAVTLVLVPRAGSVTSLVLPAVIFGTAQGINMPSIMTVLTASAPMAYRGAFMSINGMVLRAGQTLGPVLMGIAFAGFGVGGPFVLGAIIALAAAALLLVVLAVGARRQASPNDAAKS